MPVYVYRNLTTGETFEVQQSIRESAWTEHPETGDPVKRIVQPVGIAFKGSGFYVNDSRSASKASSSKGTPSEPSGTSGARSGSATPPPAKDATQGSSSSKAGSAAD